MTRLILAAFAAVALGAAVSSANAKLAYNSTQLTGVAAAGASTGTVDSVVLPSGETLDLR